jgi:hypothetical protein
MEVSNNRINNNKNYFSSEINSDISIMKTYED